MGVIIHQKVRTQLEQWQSEGYGALPVCMAKTQFSFSTDPTLLGAPNGFEVPVREVTLVGRSWFYCRNLR